MARISVARSGGNYHITLKGRLTAADLGRLERACGSALEQKPAPLEVDIERVHVIDDAARSYLERLSARGARIRGGLISHTGSQQ